MLYDLDATYMWHLNKKTNEQTEKNRSSLTDVEKEPYSPFARGETGGGKGKSEGSERYKFAGIKSISHRDGNVQHREYGQLYHNNLA